MIINFIQLNKRILNIIEEIINSYKYKKKKLNKKGNTKKTETHKINNNKVLNRKIFK